MTPPFDTVALDRLAADYWDAQLELSPLFATTLGDRRFDALVPPVRDEDLARGRARLAEILERLDGLGDAPAGPAAVTASELREAIRNELSVIDSGLHRWSVDPSDGIPTQYLDVPSFQSVRTVADGEAMI